ncbi:flavin reductase family protein [Aspergillus homomorphus CBS 101889]|uniref:Flavin reductase like domain-containing protein n=1 Tax=Aspergillus homomorphus (strain CBS 101889) TaxID=1450537 RepID=A0A395HKZ1_ASPHC|nr:hypothetical protein BO97DRAFT_437871 [Aspergillus homomorphus CBS 101889]RAL08093.1 hypothetical protein BO97DRAFT_437871 [Aspergillus homomorphus CBS 101889]
MPLKREQEQDQLHGQSQFRPYPTHKVNRMLEPGPVVLVTTGSLADRTHNIMTMGFHMMIQHEEPTLIGACIGPWDKSFDNLRRTGQCVLAVPAAELLEQVVDIGNCSGETVDKWEAFGMIPVEPPVLPLPPQTDPESGDGEEKGEGYMKQVKNARAPLVGGKDIIANIQCVVHDRTLVATYNLWVLRVVGAWVNRDLDLDYGQSNQESPEYCGAVGGGKKQMRMVHHRGDGRFVVDGEELDLRQRMIKWEEFQD